MIYAHIPRPKPMTNADRIRAMSDEELVNWVGGFCPYDKCPKLECDECVLSWLKQPYGGADHEHQTM